MNALRKLFPMAAALLASFPSHVPTIPPPVRRRKVSIDAVKTSYGEGTEVVFQKRNGSTHVQVTAKKTVLDLAQRAAEKRARKNRERLFASFEKRLDALAAGGHTPENELALLALMEEMKPYLEEK